MDALLEFERVSQTFAALQPTNTRQLRSSITKTSANSFLPSTLPSATNLLTPPHTWFSVLMHFIFRFIEPS